MGIGFKNGLGLKDGCGNIFLLFSDFLYLVWRSCLEFLDLRLVW